MVKKFLLYILTVLAVSAYSQDFEVAPVNIEFNAEPGETQTKSLTIKNHANKKTDILLSLQDFFVNKEGKTEFLEPNSLRNSIANWISISPSYISVAPNESKTVNVTLQAPIDDYSSRWGIISVTPTVERTAFAAGENLSAGVGVSGRININVFYSPASNQNYRAKINTLKEITEEGDSIRKFSVNVDNVGDKITQCKIFLIAANLSTAEEKQFEPITLVAYPKSARTVILTLPDVLPKGKYSLSAILDFGSSSSLEGTQILIDVP